MMWPKVIVVIVVVSCLGCQAQKLNSKKSAFEFRSVRVNQVWEKAQRIGIKGKDLERLRLDLKAHDEKAYQLKKVERDGGDQTGDQMEKLHRQLTEIMKKHSIIPNEKPDTFKPSKDQTFEDKRLNQLWKKTLAAKHFNDQDLEMMKQQLTLHQDKINVYKTLVDDLYGEDEGPNSVLTQQQKQVDKKAFQFKERDLKLKHKKLNKDFEMLSVKTVPEEERGGFVEPRIINFWKQAVQANFTEEELASLKEELSHFQAKLMHYSDIQIEAMRAENAYHEAKSKGEKFDRKNHHSLQDTIKETGKSIKKYFTEMKEKIESRSMQHIEL